MGDSDGIRTGTDPGVWGRHADAGEGTYTLVVGLETAATVEVGALGTREFDPGWYAYTGSAFGPGGFARIRRHRELAAGERDTRHWHVDYLLGHPDAAVEAVATTPGVNVECAVSGALDGERVPGFGASDCVCDSHLVSARRRDDLLWTVERAHAARR
jgi:endonuclease-3